ncbi:hypothetical protein [Mesorhizobium sp.]|uniref:hypothetical protein n=1 Tax=Mesorhizobium sp. TaxID=1871066 RepID=UPI000FE7D3CE|nr:hypothetical protein [Mesorhizobium sp.]RWO85753.1 MAG: hypothetical protein EOQ96_16800 [Mesorhizobium sp.]
MSEIKAREDRARRRLARLGYRLNKTPSRSWLRAYYGPGYMILDGSTVVSGCSDREYSDTLERVEDFIGLLGQSRRL